MNLEIRLETTADHREVEELTREAFWNVNVPGCSEHFLLHNIRKCPDFIPALDFVAVLDGRIVGHIVFTKARVARDDGSSIDVLSFGPLSVLPELQRRGVGGRLVRHGLAAAKDMGFAAVLIYGDPRYYHRFGFRCAERFDIRTSWGKYAVALMALELRENALSGGGSFRESPAYDVDPAAAEEFDRSFPPKEKGHTPSQDMFSLMLQLQY